MVIANSGNKSNILAKVELPHDICCREPFMPIVILLNFGGENRPINFRIDMIEILHNILIERKGEVKIVITVAQKVMMLEFAIQKVRDTNITAIIARTCNIRHININEFCVLIKPPIVPICEPLTIFLTILASYFDIPIKIFSKIK